MTGRKFYMFTWEMYSFTRNSAYTILIQNDRTYTIHRPGVI